jgi:hypothetical protein
VTFKWLLPHVSVNWFDSKSSKALTDLLNTSVGSSSYTVFKCPRSFGLYPVLSSCTRYYHCRYGVAGVEECPANTVFETLTSVCVHPDQSMRTECSAPLIHNIACPHLRGYPPRFGDHDRIAHPTDCSKYYICLLNGQPRLASCPRPMVFDAEFGFCQFYGRVAGCETFYTDPEGEASVYLFLLLVPFCDVLLIFRPTRRTPSNPATSGRGSSSPRPQLPRCDRFILFYIE